MVFKIKNLKIIVLYFRFVVEKMKFSAKINKIDVNMDSTKNVKSFLFSIFASKTSIGNTISFVPKISKFESNQKLNAECT